MGLPGSSGGGCTITLWDLAKRQPLGLPLKAHKDSVRSVVFSPDGKTLASGGTSGNILLWDVASRQPLGPPLPGYTAEATLSLAFSPDSRTLAAGGIEGEIILWDLDPASWQARACRIANRNLTREEWQQYLGDEPYRLTCPNLPAPGK